MDRFYESQSPQAGQFNSYRLKMNHEEMKQIAKSQSPQAGQFNSYRLFGSAADLVEAVEGLNPLKRVNSILTQI